MLLVNRCRYENVHSHIKLRMFLRSYKITCGHFDGSPREWELLLHLSIIRGYQEFHFNGSPAAWD